MPFIFLPRTRWGHRTSPLAFGAHRICRAELREAIGERARAAQDYAQVLVNDPHFTAPYLRDAYVALHEGRSAETLSLCDSLLAVLRHAPPAASDSAYFAAQKQQVHALQEQCAQAQ